MEFRLHSKFAPMGDQPQAISQIVENVQSGGEHTVLLGVTGSGKTFTIANAIARLGRPVLVLSHNKTLAAQLYGEFKNFFPENAVEYYVSYYDYYQPEAYLPTTDKYIEKDLSINDEIEKLRLSTMSTLLSGRRDVIVVSSVSCIYGIGNPEDFHANTVTLKCGDRISYRKLMNQLVVALYTRTQAELSPGTFRAGGESLDIMSAVGNAAYRILFFDDEIEQIWSIDPVTGQKISSLESVSLYPANMFVTTPERIGRAVSEIYLDLGERIKFFEMENRPMEAQRIRQRVESDLEMIKELGYCPGIENYSRYFDGRKPGTRPFCLIDCFPKDFITVIDESHVTVPQIRGMYGGDYKRKLNLVEYGFRLPAAHDNRPLKFNEFQQLQNTSIYVSATPEKYELEKCGGCVIEQIIRPTGLIDPAFEVRLREQPVDDLLEEARLCAERDDKVIVTTITKRNAEDLSKHLDKIGVRNRYIHCDVDTLERVQIIEDLRNGLFDVLIGVNLLREGIDLPEVQLVAILDADKEGLLRNVRALTQIAGRSARNEKGRVILYAREMVGSLRTAIMESNRRREKQILFNLENGIVPQKAKKSGSGQKDLLNSVSEEERKSGMLKAHTPQEAAYVLPRPETMTEEELQKMIEKKKEDMTNAAKSLDFMAAARFRDQMYELQKIREQRLGAKG